MAKKKMPGFDKYYMDLAESVSKRANCLSKKVGAIIVLGNRIVATGYNGVPDGMTNCMDNGCEVCRKKHLKRKKRSYKKKRNGSGQGYDNCICVHAEQNALMTAARVGIPIEGGSVYSVYQPCFGCLKQMLQAKIRKVLFRKDWTPDDRLLGPYQDIQDEFPDGVWKFHSNDDFELVSKKRMRTGSTETVARPVRVPSATHPIATRRINGRGNGRGDSQPL
jgi:dCMP deaminase